VEGYCYLMEILPRKLPGRTEKQSVSIADVPAGIRTEYSRIQVWRAEGNVESRSY
jgi:hypothetical protein